MSEHLDTNSVVDSKSPLRHATVIFLKRRPPGRSNNRRVAKQSPPIALMSREPVNLGDVGGGTHSAVLLVVRRTNSRSSRRGKEQIRPNPSKTVEVRWSDLMVGENP